MNCSVWCEKSVRCFAAYLFCCCKDFYQFFFKFELNSMIMLFDADKVTTLQTVCNQVAVGLYVQISIFKEKENYYFFSSKCVSILICVYVSRQH